MTDSELLRQFADEGREDAFTELVRRRLDLVYGAALRQVGGDAHRAQDIAQLVFIDLARKARSVSRHPSVLGWLYTSTHFAALNLIRTEQRRQRREEEAHAMHEFAGQVVPDADWDRVRPVLDAAMHELSERERRVVLLRFFDRQTFAAIGIEVGLTENAARKSVERALDRLHGLLARRGITSAAAALAILLEHQTVAAAPGGLAATIVSGALTPLAAASAGGGALAGIVSFMSTAKITMGIAALGIFAAGTGVYYATQVARAEALVASIDRESEGRLARLRELQLRLTAAEAARSAQAAVAAAPVPGTAGASASTPVDPSANEAKAREAAIREAVARDLLANPQFNELKLQRARADIRRYWNLFYLGLGLTSGQVAQFESLLANSMAEDWRIRNAAQLQGRDRKDPATQELIEKARVRLENNVRGLLGESGLLRFLDHERAWKVEDLAASLAARVYFTDNPLTREQARQLGEILASRSPQFQQGKNVGNGDIEWDRALADAARILTPLQLGALRSIRANLVWQDELAAVTKPPAGGNSR